MASWVNRRQQEVIEFFHAEKVVLKVKPGNKRIVLSCDQCRRLAFKGEIDFSLRQSLRTRPLWNAHVFGPDIMCVRVRCMLHRSSSLVRPTEKRLC
ncbi:MAG: hypothetical protein VYA84_12550 [Planctomycetota bacterium]|nr:hypothetical protein [Planctomycetota bacterium]